MVNWFWANTTLSQNCFIRSKLYCTVTIVMTLIVKDYVYVLIAFTFVVLQWYWINAVETQHKLDLFQIIVQVSRSLTTDIHVD